MLSYEGFTLIIMLFILAPIMGAIALLFLFIFEKRIDLLENKNKEIRLEQALQEAQYNKLNQQIQPHFLFNTLNVILGLARLNRTAELIRALEAFSQFLKFKYKASEPLIPLSQEIQYTQHYLDIQSLRFGDRLKIDMVCPDQLSIALVPPFILQTLVENSFKHGLEKKVGEALLHIRFHQNSQTVYLVVKDNGLMGNTTTFTDEGGHGLDNIKKRLYLYFSDRAQLNISSNESGTMVKVSWPLVYDKKVEEANQE
ncbi:Sensor histidine kinase YehU [Peribacillus sp. Bi96]|uniref:sensor histidine kinase n=1 Tax=Peribacillus sp. Bi96 TaxID=2884273 RepID=UPI001D9660DB|nr:histidine kinase [Peribacillus sp. Bi96]CAH0283954.1 Sensor histidine kinase YehU [Peribacillus sp. Bi96]